MCTPRQSFQDHLAWHKTKDINYWILSPLHHVCEVPAWQQQTHFWTFRLFGVHSCGVGLCFRISPALISVNHRQGCCLVVLFLFETDPSTRRGSVFVVGYLGKEQATWHAVTLMLLPHLQSAGSSANTRSAAVVVSGRRISGFDKSSTFRILLLGIVASVISIGHSFKSCSAASSGAYIHPLLCVLHTKLCTSITSLSKDT